MRFKAIHLWLERFLVRGGRTTRSAQPRSRAPYSSERILAGLFLVALGAVATFSLCVDRPPVELRLVPCPIYALSAIPCPGCGMTRACVSLVQGRFADAWNYHPYAFLVVALALGVLFVPDQMRHWRRLPALVRWILPAGAIVGVLGLWIDRLSAL